MKPFTSHRWLGLVLLAALSPCVLAETVRFATFNASLNRDSAGQLLDDLSLPRLVDHARAWPDIGSLSVQQRRVLQAHHVAEILQKVRADVLLVNEFDFDRDGVATADSTPAPLGYASAAARLFHDNFLALAHGGADTGRAASAPLRYAHRYTPNTNTGVPSGLPTPPVFDGPEDRNGKRNHDEIRLLKDYIHGASYLVDDAGKRGGLGPGAMFVLAGDFNADLCDGDSYKARCLAAHTPGPGPNAIAQLLLDPLVNTGLTPHSAGATAAATDPDNNGPANQGHLNDPAFDTADFSNANPGNLRVDYVLPSVNLKMLAAGVFWPTRQDNDFALVGTFNKPNLYASFASSDHKAVWVDVVVPATSSARSGAAKATSKVPRP